MHVGQTAVLVMLTNVPTHDSEPLVILRVAKLGKALPVALTLAIALVQPVTVFRILKV